MAFFESKEKKAQRIAAEEASKTDAEFEAKFVAKQEKKKVEKMIAETDKSINNLIARAATAKGKGFTEVYQQCVSLIKVARARKRQAEVFLFQMEAMQEMQALSKNSAELLSSMGNVMNSLGKLSVDKTVMLNTQKNFAAAQMELDRQANDIDMFMSGMEMYVPGDDTVMDQVGGGDIDAEIDSYIVNNALASQESNTNSELNVENEMEYLKQVLNS